ncbi:diguanylate cyclase (GGDEF)-like protein/PAS domain S-box-containing protein [Paucibacter oligotrophus]|uniref:diguanylate cyclase n=1 Tax=Roseateles oligotrophus TaxID=1769250 RepID=A0A840L323_9BURK|nr:diguanylate cyclase [Roseateles oligotrophus]MBB4842884.1 diguanylate cyclase (GGDEF)-like protein/PAS domain S-box-containing protein [Roseateles oligotrophus]
MAAVFAHHKQASRAVPRWLGLAAALGLAALGLACWQAGAVRQTPPAFVAPLLVLLLAGLCLCLLGLWHAWQRKLAAAQSYRQGVQQILTEAIEAMPAGFELWDKHDHLVICNQRLREQYPSLADLLVPGVPLHKVLEHALQNGAIPGAIGNETRWLEQRLARRGHQQQPVVEEYGGRWTHIHERRTPSGFTVGIRLDVSELILTQQALAEAKAQAQHDRQLLERAIDAMPAGIEIYDEHERLVMANQRLADWQPRLQQAGTPRLAPTAQQADSQDRTQLSQLPDGLWLKTSQTRTPEGFVLTVHQDVSDLVHQEQALKASQAQLQAIIGTAGVSIITIDGSGIILSCNLAVERLFGYSRGEMLGHNVSMLMLDKERLAHDEYLLRFARGQGGRLMNQPRELQARHRSGMTLTVQLAVTEVPEQQERLFVGVISDLTDRKQFEQELQRVNEQLLRLSTTDSLTELANRRLLMQRLEEEWRRGLRSHQSLALLLIDVDYFKLYNDHYGHQAGDSCLLTVAQVLRNAANRPGDLVARYGGEEFVVLLAQTDEAGMQAVAARLRELLAAAAIEHKGSPLRPSVTVSIGMCSCPPTPGTFASQWLAQADRALYQAKALGRDRAVSALELLPE